MKHAEKKSHRPRIHKDWRVWLAIGLMLAAMGIYVFTLDDAVQPESAAGDSPPSASKTAKPSK